MGTEMGTEMGARMGTEIAMLNVKLTDCFTKARAPVPSTFSCIILQPLYFISVGEQDKAISPLKLFQMAEMCCGI